MGDVVSLTFKDFNPRSREGSDRNGLFAKKYFMISIHAPAKGATPLFDQISGLHSNFNPRSREGSDRLGDVVSLTFKDFNPRSREGSDSFRQLCRFSLG